ncbi:MAG: hypothetical protein RSE94_03250 [Pseudomonas sp.]
MATLTIADLDNGKRDLETVDAVANSQADTTTTRYGQQTLTLAGALRRLGEKGDAIIRNLGYFVPVDYAPGLSVTEPNFTVIGPDGKVYAAQAGQLPFTTGAWDAAQWYPIQNDLNDHKLLVFDTRVEAEAAATTLPDGQPVQIQADSSFSGNPSVSTVSAGALSGSQPIKPPVSGSLTLSAGWPDVPKLEDPNSAQQEAYNAQAEALGARTESLKQDASDLAASTDERFHHVDRSPLHLSGLNPIQIAAIPAPDSSVIPTGSRVNQGIYLSESTGVFFSSWLKNTSGDTLIRRLDFSGNTLAEITVPGGGGCGAIYPVLDADGSSVFIFAGGYSAAGNIIVLKNDAVLRTVPFTLEGRAGGSTFAVDTSDPTYSYGAMYFYKSDGTLWVVPKIPVAPLIAGGHTIDVSKAFQITLPDGAAFQTIGYYMGETFVLCGNDGTSTSKYILRFSEKGELLEQVAHNVDRLYAETEGNIREPEGMCIVADSRTGAPTVYTTVCFGSHAAPIIRLYKMQIGEAGTAVHIEGYAGRSTFTVSPPRVVDVSVIFSKSGANWIANNGATVSASGKMTVKNVRTDATALLFDLHKPYVACIAFSISVASPMHENRITPAWAYVAGGATSASGQRVTFFNPVANAYVPAADVPSGSVFCLNLRLAYGR